MAPIFTGSRMGFGRVDAPSGAISASTGGTIYTPGDGYVYHVFTSSDTFQINTSLNLDVFLVAGGGGGGGSNRGAAAGAGGLIYRPAQPVTANTPYSVFIGGGGAAGPANNSNAAVVGTNGQNTTFGAPQTSPWPASALVALGGGRGGAGDNLNNGGTGGSGGSSWYPNYPAVAALQDASPNPQGIPADSITYGWGYPSGSSSSTPVYGGGGGGSGSAGRPANDGTYAGGGGAGKTYSQFNATNLPGTPFSPKNGNFAGGGTSADFQGGYRANPESFPFGGGGGNNGPGFTPGSDPNVNGFINTGGGGGSGGNGGPGVCIVRYKADFTNAPLQPAGKPMVASGGTVVDSGGFRTHIFTSSSTPGFNITSLGPGTAEVLVVAGGAAGGGGGGGAGGVRNFPYTFTSTGSYPIVVGGGGSPGGQEQPNVDAGDGNPSYISNPGGAIIFATGGGGGGMHDHPPAIGQTGGSGGGRAAIGPGFQPGSPTVASPDGISPTVQGYPGGGAYLYDGGNGTSAGGGGAGAKGGDGTPPANGTGRVAGPGGIGVPISWMPPSYGTPGPQPGRYFAGGGGGAGWGNIGAPGGSGGGGSGGYRPGVTPTSSGEAGTTNTGGGGGATSYPPYGTGGTGGSGIIAIRYPI